MSKVYPRFRISRTSGGLFTIFCDSWKNEKHNVVDGRYTLKPPKNSPHQHFAHIDSLRVCTRCNNTGCKLHHTLNIFNKTIDFGREVCHVCEEHYISVGFSIIFKQLIMVGLLPKDYKLVCCYCYRSGYKERSDIPHEFLNHR